MGGDIRGGEGTLQIFFNNGTELDSLEKKIHIRGYNPVEANVETYFTRDIPYKVIARHESREGNSYYCQFTTRGKVNEGEADVKWTPNWGDDGPGKPGGFGIMQLTDPIPTSQQLWSWKDNLVEGIRRINDIYMPAAMNHLQSYGNYTQDMVDKETLARYNGWGPIVNGDRLGHYYKRNPDVNDWVLNENSVNCNTNHCTSVNSLWYQNAEGAWRCSPSGLCYTVYILNNFN
jgi:hypothetical protein